MTRVSLTDEEVSPSAQVSVVIPAYNRAGQVGRALESVSRQTYPHWEIVVVDDASTDGTAQAVEARAADIGHLRLARHACNLGAQAARNTGIRASRGPWIAFLDSDDWWEPDSLELRLAEARRLLSATELAVGEIAEATGFANQFHFSRAFRRASGMTPSAYRRAHSGWVV